jgi:uncharacterized protein (DUF433 family)
MHQAVEPAILWRRSRSLCVLDGSAVHFLPNWENSLPATGTATHFAGFLKQTQPAIFCCMKREELKGIVHSDPEIMGGTPVFVGTRVPLQNLVDYLEGGESIEDFLDAFPTVKREQVIAVIEAGKLTMLGTV